MTNLETFAPDLFEKMGRAVGDAVSRAQHPPASTSGSNALIEALPAAIYLTDAAGRITFFNEGAAKLWGCRPELGKSEFCGSWKLYWPDGTPLPHDQCPMALALREKRPIRGMEAVAERPDGTRIPFLPYSTPLFDDNGELIGAVNMLVDISEHRHIEEQLRESEARYRGIFQSARVAVWEEDFSSVAAMLDDIKRQGIEDLREYFAARPDRITEAVARVRIHDVNDYTVKLFEADRKETLLGSLAGVFLPETMPIFVEELVALWEGRRGFESETVLRTLKGRKLNVIFTMTFNGARCERTIVSVLDITERKAAELAAQQLAAIVESSHDAIISIDLNGIITSWNHGAVRLYGYTVEDAMGQSVTLIFPEDCRDEETEIIGRIRRGERVDHYETIRRRKDGSVVDISLTVSPVRNAEGIIIGASKVARDITESKRAREQQRLILNEMKHRMKNSLLTVQAIASQTLSSASPEQRDAFVARLHSLAEAHELLTLDSWNGASLKAVITKALEPFQEQHRDRILLRCASDVWIDANKSLSLAMILHELATNAVKYGALSNGTGQVHLEWKHRPDTKKVTFVWREVGGPKVETPNHNGFGSRLLAKALAGDLKSNLQFKPVGIVYTLEMVV